MKRVKYIGPVFDHSGYGEASRNYVLALHKAGVPLTLQPHCFEPSPPPVGTAEDRQILNSLVSQDDDNFDIVIVHLTPDLAPRYARQYADKYVISYTVWETSHIHPVWVQACNMVNEVWVPCDWNIHAFQESGVTVPMHKIHHGIDPTTFDGVDPKEFNVAGIDKESTFVFLSVMQWSSRKNPDALLRAYFNAFGPDDNVRLVLKAYVGRGLPPAEDSRRLKEMINRIKSDMQLPNYPKMNLLTAPLSSEDMRSLYMYSDAYVSLTKGEGFGLTMLEAGLAGKPVIATGMGGNMEYMTEENSYPVPFQWDYVMGMGGFNAWYWGNQQWAHPHVPQAAKIMRHVYDNREEAAAKGAKLRDRIKKEFSWEVAANQMISRLKEL